MNNSERDQWRRSDIEYRNKTLTIDGYQVMQEWERPIMKFLAKSVTESKRGNILEIGFGMGISAEYILNDGCAKYTLIEAHPKVIEMAMKWKKKQKRYDDIRIIPGFWEDIIDTLGKFDGILFDTCPVTEYKRNNWFTHFFPLALQHLNTNGIFTYYSNESENFRKSHFENLLKNFSEVTLHRVDNLQPKNCEYWNNDHIIIPVIKKRAVLLT